MIQDVNLLNDSEGCALFEVSTACVILSTDMVFQGESWRQDGWRSEPHFGHLHERVPTGRRHCSLPGQLGHLRDGGGKRRGIPGTHAS